MRLSLPMIAAALAVSLAGCRGEMSSGNGALYHFATPALHSQRLYAETITDSQHSVILLSYTETVTAVNSDGSYTLVQVTPSNQPLVVEGTSYFIRNETLSVNSSGQTTAYTFLAPGGVAVTCTYVPNGPGPDFPVAAGVTWTLDYTFACGQQLAVAYVQNGTAVDVESVTVPAGTFNAIKLQSTISWTDALGTTTTQTVTSWRDVMTSVSIKESVTITYAGTPPITGSPISTDTVLQSLT